VLLIFRSWLFLIPLQFHWRMRNWLEPTIPKPSINKLNHRKKERPIDQLDSNSSTRLVHSLFYSHFFWELAYPTLINKAWTISIPSESNTCKISYIFSLQEIRDRRKRREICSVWVRVLLAGLCLLEAARPVELSPHLTKLDHLLLLHLEVLPRRIPLKRVQRTCKKPATVNSVKKKVPS